MQRKEREAGLVQVGASEQGAQHLTHLTIGKCISILGFLSRVFHPTPGRIDLKIHLLLRLPGAEDLCGAIKKAYQASAEFLGLQCFEGNLGNLKIKMFSFF